jgi:hypothetical protein
MNLIWPTRYPRSVPFYNTIIGHLWWRFMPGTTIKVRWPRGQVVEDRDNGIKIERFSSDPWDHYGPWLQQHAGRLGWDWRWDLTDNDAADDRLTIKFRWGRRQQAMMAAIMWQ